MGYSDFLEEVRAKRIKTATIQEGQGGTEIVATTNDERKIKTTATYLDRGLVGDLIANGVKFDVKPREEGSLIMTLLAIPILGETIRWRRVISTAVGGMPITTTIEWLERYSVNLRYNRELRDDLPALRRVAVPRPGGGEIPLEEVADIQISRGPMVIRSEGTRPNSWVFIDLSTSDLGGYVKQPSLNCGGQELNGVFEATGWDNILYRSYLQGETPKSIRGKVDEIAAFSELGEFLNIPVRNYSAGMMLRLAFSIATAINPEVLLVDEILAVGDLAFLHKAKARMRDLMSASRVMVMVAHDLLAIAEVCNRVIWMEHGRVRAQGEPKEIVTQYIAACVKNPSPELGLALNGLEGVRGAPLPPLPEPGKAA